MAKTPANVNETRLANLRRLIQEHNGPSALAKKLGYTNASFIVQMTGPNPMRSVTEKTARSFEKKLGLPTGALDQPQAQEAPTMPAASAQMPLAVDVIRLVGRVLEDEGVNLPPVKFADLVAFALTESVEQQRIATPDQVKRVVRLMK